MIEENKIKEELPPLTRCGQCGDWLCDPSLYTEKEQSEAELTYCDNCARQENSQVITRDMAIDAEDLSLEGQRY